LSGCGGAFGHVRNPWGPRHARGDSWPKVWFGTDSLFLAEYATGQDLGVDNLLPHHGSDFLSGWPLLPTSLNFFAIGFALALIWARGNAARIIRSAFAVIVIVILSVASSALLASRDHFGWP
jgi:hypothetical protein